MSKDDKLGIIPIIYLCIAAVYFLFQVAKLAWQNMTSEEEK